jgi:hypothetical protein
MITLIGTAFYSSVQYNEKQAQKVAKAAAAERSSGSDYEQMETGKMPQLTSEENAPLATER